MKNNNEVGVRSSRAHDPAPWCRYGLALAMLAGATGCQSYDWRDDFRQAEQEARAQDRYLLVFYKWWLDETSNRMIELLSDPDVQPLFKDTVNVLIDKDYGAASIEYVNKFGVAEPPAVIIVAPDGTYQVRTGYVPKDRFIEFATRAMSATPPRPKPEASGKPGGG